MKRKITIETMKTEINKKQRKKKWYEQSKEMNAEGQELSSRKRI